MNCEFQTVVRINQPVIKMESRCVCGVGDIRKCRCLPAQVPQVQRGNIYVNRGGSRGGNARGGRDQSLHVDRDVSSWRNRDGSSLRDRHGSSWRNNDGSSCRDRDGSFWRNRDGSSWRVRDGSSWRDRGENPRGALDRGTSCVRNRSARGVEPTLLPMPRGNNGESVAWRGGRGRGSDRPEQRGAPFPGNAAERRGGYRNVGLLHCDGINNKRHYYGGYDTDGCYDGFHEYSNFGGGRGVHFHPRGAGRGQFGVMGNNISMKRDALLRSSGARCRNNSFSLSIDHCPESVFANRYDVALGSDSEQQKILAKKKSSSSKKVEMANKLAGRNRTAKKIPGKSIDNLKGLDGKENVRESTKGIYSTLHNNRKSRSPKNEVKKYPLGNSRNRNNSVSSNDSNSSRNTSGSSVIAKNSRVKRGKSYSCSSESESGRSVSDNRHRKSDISRMKSDSSRKKSDSSHRKRDDRRRKSESSRIKKGSSRNKSKGSSDCSESSDGNNSSNDGSRSSSASSSSSSEGSCQSRGKCGKSRNNHFTRGQTDGPKSGNKLETLKYKHVDVSSKNINGKNKRDEARKSPHTSNRNGGRNSKKHRDENSSKKFSHTQGFKNDHRSPDESDETKAKATSETKTSKESLRKKSEESSSSKTCLDAPSKDIEIGNASVMDGADPLVLPAEEYKFLMGSGTSSPEIGSIVNTIQSQPFASDSSSCKVMTLTDGDSQKWGTAPFPVIRYEWQFQDEQGSWITYGQPSPEGSPASVIKVSSDDIEKHYINDPNKQPVEIESNKVRYVLDFTTMTQTNRQTSHQRCIRRVVKRPQAPTAPIKLLKSGSAVNIDYEWQFQDELGVWVTYGQPSTKGGPESGTTVSSDDIEKHYIEDSAKQSIEIQSNLYHYKLDFTAMTQTNKQTSGQRHIRRVLKHLQNQSANPDIAVDASGLTNGQYEWQFQDEHQAWIRYGSPNSGGDLSCATTRSSSDIENHYCNDRNKSPFLIQSKKYRYLLNLQAMTQTNLRTKTQRPIRRVATQAPKSTETQKTPNKDIPSAFEHEWFFLDESNRWIAYGQPNIKNKLECVTNISSDDIEKHYQQDQKKKFFITSQQHQYLVSFLEMTQTNTQTNTVRIIRRFKKNSSAAHSARETLSRDSFSESMPANWSPMPSSTPCTKFVLRSSDPEYTLHTGAVQSAVPNIKIVNMYRVQNKYLWKAYTNKMEYLKQQFPGINYKEEFLYHGTSPANVEAICKENVDWRLHGSKNGNSYGRGSYFSNSAQLSAGYSTRRRTMASFRNPSVTFAAQRLGLSSASHQNGQPAAQPAPTRAMFIVRVLVGNITQGDSNTVKPPVDGSGQPFDTTVDNVAKPTIFVKYDTQEYYPEYYIEFD